jgi:bacillithiol biosynthesis cysteine-adding enzyme BshC
MQFKPVQLHNQSRFITDYQNQSAQVMKYFDYSPSGDYTSRLNDLMERDFNREKLTNVLHTMNQQWDAPESTIHNIERLKQENSVVVIGGQQAGLLTGPMYTINKMISVIQLARQQETALNTPVIPVFWIAGEDHDFAEMNHIFLPETPKMHKYKLQQQVQDKASVSHTQIDETHSQQWVDRLFEQLKETQYTKDLYQIILHCLDASTTYTDFFARVVFQLYQEEGLVLIDSAHPEVRQMERDHFLQMIENQPAISEGVYAATQQIKQDGYTISLDVEQQDAHLFYHVNNERILLVKDKHGEWIGKQNEVRLTTEALVEIARNNPESLSNNVVTRPLMQELLFPTLAFIGGPGEISYWSVLKPAFHIMNMNMPPVVPRLSFTYIERNIEKTLVRYHISVEQAVNEGVTELKADWLAAKSNPEIEKLAEDVKSTIAQAHQPLRDYAGSLGADLGDLAEKNLFYLNRDVDYLRDRLVKEIEQKYAKELYEFDLLNIALHPEGGLQERVWNPLPWINEYGVGFIREITKAPCSFDHNHYIVCI